MEKNIESLIETVGFIKEKMVTKDDLKDVRGALSTVEKRLDTKIDHVESILSMKIDHVESKLDAFENNEVGRRKRLEVRVTKLEHKVLS